MSNQEFKPIKEGKVREVYDNGDSLIIVATDRISAFDVILKNKITDKGAILTQMSKFWFDYTKDIVPNHMLSTDVKDMPEFFRKPEFDGNSMECRKLEMLPWIHNRKRLEELSGKRYSLRNQTAGRLKGIGQAAGADLHTEYQGGAWPA